MPTSVTVAMLNAIRNSATTDYTTRVPLATRTNITTVGNAVTSYAATLNEFTNALVNKIAVTVISSKMASNRLAIFKKGFVPYGKSIEEVFVGMAAAASFDKTGATTLARTLPDVKTIYHTENRQDFYTATVTKAQVHSAFQSETGVMDLLAEIVNSMYSGAEYDEYILMKKLLADYAANYEDYGVTAITDTATTAKFVKTVRKAVADMSFVCTNCNKAGVKTFTRPEDQVLIVNKDVIAEVDVEVLAKAFNLGSTDMQAKILVVDDFADMTNTYAVLIDKDFFMVYDTLREATMQENAQGLFTNHFLHIHQILSTSQFKNAIRFTTVPK